MQTKDNAKIMVVGCGALGNEVLKNLVLSGVCNLWIVDFDRVERHNLNRSVLYRNSDADVGRLKVDAAKERLMQLSEGLSLHCINGDFCHDVGLGLIMEMDVVVACVDSRWTRYIINRKCMRAGIPWVDGGISGLEGTARVFMPGKNCYACNLSPESKAHMQRRMSCSTAISRAEETQSVPTTVIAASVIGAVQAQEALKLVGGETTGSLCGRMFYYEGETMNTRTLRFEAYDDDCPEHERWQVEETVIPQNAAVLPFLSTMGGARLRLRDFVFVDYVEDKQTGETVSVMLPDYEVEEFLCRSEKYDGKPMSRFYQHSFSVIDDSFPYPELSFMHLGYPEDDIAEVEESGIIRHYRLTKSEKH
ncbi:MAG: HesA/MoeB/ThiF family protein [Bacteroidaceae bacterium]|nr:HesA/MoeB/ThiF family protein [Bacteroidaceae bacterium]